MRGTTHSRVLGMLTLMKRVLPAVALVLALAGCTASGPSAEGGSSAAPAASATEVASAPPAAPAVFTTEQAASAYLDAVCPSNIAARNHNVTYDTLLAAGPGGDVAPVQATAVALRDANQASAVAIGSHMAEWPEAVKADMAVIEQSYFQDLADIDRIIQSTNADQVLAVTFTPRTEAQKAAGPRVRTLLGLDLDTQASCENR